MTLLLAFLLAQTSTLVLTPGVDVWNVAQSTMDAAPPGSTIRIPAGDWTTSQPINVPPRITVRGAGMDKTRLKSLATNGVFGGPVLGWGGGGRWSNSAGRARSDGVKILDLEIVQTANASTNDKCCWGETGDDALIQRVRVRGAAYEGIVGGTWSKRVSVIDCEAVDCGNGGPAYTLSTAGINVTSMFSKIVNCHTTGCGQGIEAGTINQIIDGCVLEKPGAGVPSFGVNIGSCGTGISNVSVRRCRVLGYGDSFVCSNGIGRLSKVTVENNYFTGSVGFAGGMLTNNVPHPDEGPDTKGSVIRGNTFLFRKSNYGGVTYYAGPEVGHAVMGREPLVVSGNTLIYKLAVDDAQTAPPIGFAGEISAICRAENNIIEGIPTSSRGDVAVFSVNNNVSQSRKFSFTNNRAFGTDGVERNLLIRIESAVGFNDPRLKFERNRVRPGSFMAVGGKRIAVN